MHECSRGFTWQHSLSIPRMSGSVKSGRTTISLLSLIVAEKAQEKMASTHSLTHSLKSSCTSVITPKVQLWYMEGPYRFGKIWCGYGQAKIEPPGGDYPYEVPPGVCTKWPLRVYTKCSRRYIQTTIRQKRCYFNSKGHSALDFCLSVKHVE